MHNTIGSCLSLIGFLVPRVDALSTAGADGRLTTSSAELSYPLKNSETDAADFVVVSVTTNLNTDLLVASGSLSPV